MVDISHWGLVLIFILYTAWQRGVFADIFAPMHQDDMSTWFLCARLCTANIFAYMKVRALAKCNLFQPEKPLKRKLNFYILKNKWGLEGYKALGLQNKFRKIPLLKHIYMRPMSVWGNFIISVHMTSGIVKLTSVQISLRSNWPKWNFKPQWVFHVNSKCPQRNKVTQNH